MVTGAKYNLALASGEGHGHKRGSFIYLFTELPPLAQHWEGDGDTVSGAEAGGHGYSLQESIFSPSTDILGLLERSPGD